MAWTDIFRSRYVRFIESELAAVRKKHTEELEGINNTHALELSRAIVEANRGWAEADRLRQYLIPGLPAANRVTESPDTTPNKETLIETGTPFQRIAARIMKQEDERYKIEEEKRKAAAGFPTVKSVVPPAMSAEEN